MYRDDDKYISRANLIDIKRNMQHAEESKYEIFVPFIRTMHGDIEWKQNAEEYFTLRWFHCRISPFILHGDKDAQHNGNDSLLLSIEI